MDNKQSSVNEMLVNYKYFDFDEAFTNNELEHIKAAMTEYASQVVGDKEDELSSWKKTAEQVQDLWQSKEIKIKQLQEAVGDKERTIAALKNVRDVQNKVMLQNNQNYQKCVQQVEYYKALAEASDFLRYFMKFDNTSHPECVEEDFERFTKAYKAYEQLKQQKP